MTLCLDNKETGLYICTQKGETMSDELSYFDAEKNYYIYRYVRDVKGDFTEHEGEIQAFVKATNSIDACDKAGMSDPNEYGARQIDDLDKFVKAIEDERKHLTKISKQLKEMTDERDEKRKEFYRNPQCPNGCGKLDEALRCPNCGYGHEGEETIKKIDDLIKEQKKKGEDTSELESLRDAIQNAVNKQEENARKLTEEAKNS